MASLLELDRTLEAGCYYTSTTPGFPEMPTLQDHKTYDVAVVGGGIAGLSTAIELAQHGLSVAVLEGQRIGFGASARNGGQVIHGLACDLGVLERQLGRAYARSIFQSTVEGVALIHRRCAQFDIDCDWQYGYLSLAVNARKARALWLDADKLERDYGHSQCRIARADMPRWVNSPRYVAGVYDASCGHINPRKYTLGLARAALSAGVHLYERSAVTQLEQGSTCTLHTPQGSVRAARVVLAGNVHLHGLHAPLHARIMPVASYIVATPPLGRELARTLIPCGAAASDNNVLLDYFRITPDQRMLYGGRVGYGRTPPPHYAQMMRSRMVRTFAPLQGQPLAYQWGGYVDVSMNQAPDFGRLGTHHNVYYLQGFSGHGVALSGLAGQLVAQALAGDAARFDVFARLRHRPFPGGQWLRSPALVLGMGWYRLKDALA